MFVYFLLHRVCVCGSFFRDCPSAHNPFLLQMTTPRRRLGRGRGSLDSS